MEAFGAFDKALPPSQVYIVLAAAAAIAGTVLNNMSTDPFGETERLFDRFVAVALALVAWLGGAHVIWLLLQRVPQTASDQEVLHLYLHVGLVAVSTTAFWAWTEIKTHVRSRF